MTPRIRSQNLTENVVAPVIRSQLSSESNVSELHAVTFFTCDDVSLVNSLNSTMHSRTLGYVKGWVVLGDFCQFSFTEFLNLYFEMWDDFFVKH